MPLEIIIAGAGLAGLTASIALIEKGHQVTIYEKRDDDDRGISASGIQMQPNALRVLQRYNMLDAVDKVSHNNLYSDLRDYQSGDTLALVDFDRRGGVRYAIRTALKQAFVREALNRGVLLHKGVGVEGVVQDRPKPVAQLSNGSRVSADLIIGADGAWSNVRKSLYPSYQPQSLSTVIFQVQVPEEFVRASQTTADMDRNNPALCLWFSPGRCCFFAHCPTAKLFDLQLSDVDYPPNKDPNPNIRLGWVNDMEALRQRFSDHPLGLRQILDKAEKYYKWRLVEVSGLPSWSNENGNVVLIGDACHAMTPYAGQGSAMGIEDAAVIAEALGNATSGDSLKDRLELYERLRRPRCEVAQKYAARLGKLWTSSNETVIAGVRQGMTRVNDPAYTEIHPEKTAPFHSPAFEKWLDLYDAAAEVGKAVDGSKRSQARL